MCVYCVLRHDCCYGGHFVCVQVAVETKQGCSNLELMCEQLLQEEKQKLEKKELKRQKKKRRKGVSTNNSATSIELTSSSLVDNENDGPSNVRTIHVDDTLRVKLFTEEICCN